MSANIKKFKIALGISNPHFWTNLVKRNISMFALIFGPTFYEVCTHLWTALINSCLCLGSSKMNGNDRNWAVPKTQSVEMKNGRSYWLRLDGNCACKWVVLKSNVDGPNEGLQSRNCARPSTL